MRARIVCTRITPRSFPSLVTSTLRVPSWAMSFATRSMPSFASTDTKFGVMMSCSRTSAGFYPGATTEDVPLRHDADGRPFGRYDDRKPVRPRGHGFRGLEHRTLRRHREELRLHDVFRVEDHPSVVTTTPVVSFAGRDLQTAEASSPSLAGFPGV